MAELVKNPPAMQETWVLPLGWEDPLEKGKATYSSILTWRIQAPWLYSSWGHKESEATDQLSLSLSRLKQQTCIRSPFCGSETWVLLSWFKVSRCHLGLQASQCSTWGGFMLNQYSTHQAVGRPQVLTACWPDTSASCHVGYLQQGTWLPWARVLRGEWE